MKIPINLPTSISAEHGLKKGDRVVSKIAKNEWYLGTVVRAGAKLYIDFDDGYDAIIEKENFKHVKLLQKPKKLKRALTDAEAKALYEVVEEKKKPAAKVEKEKPKAKPIALPIKKPALIKKPTPLPGKHPIPQPTPKPEPTPAPKPVHVPTPEPTPVHTKKLDERKYKDNWIVYLEGHGKTTWRYTVQDDPKDHTFKYRASSMLSSPQEALEKAFWEMIDRTKTFTISYTPPLTSDKAADFKTHTIENVTFDDAKQKLGELIKSLVPAPTNKPVAPPVKPPIHAPQVKREEPAESRFQVYLVPNELGEWSYSLADAPNSLKVFHHSAYVHDTPHKALEYAINALPDGVATFTLHYAESVLGNAMQNTTVFKDITAERAKNVVLNLMRQAGMKNEHWFINLMNDAHSPGLHSWRFVVSNHEVDSRLAHKYVMPPVKVYEESKINYPSALEAFKAGAKLIPRSTFNLVYYNPDKIVHENVGPSMAESILSKLGGSTLKIDADLDYSAPWLKCGQKALFEKAAKGDDRRMMEYMTTIWHRANEICFGNRLKFPKTLRFLKEQQTSSFRTRGHWVARDRELAMSRRVFNAGEEKFLEVFVHEMCHQAVSEIDHVVDSEGGHGPYWKAWMVRCGIPPSRYDYTAQTEYMDNEEKRKHDVKLQGLEIAKQQKQEMTRVSNRSPMGTPAQFYWAEKSAWVQGVVVGIYDSKLIVVTDKETGAFVSLPNEGHDRLFEIPPGMEKDDYYDDRWSKATKRVHDYIRNKKLLKQVKKAAKGGLSPAGIRAILGY